MSDSNADASPRSETQEYEIEALSSLGVGQLKALLVHQGFTND